MSSRSSRRAVDERPIIPLTSRRSVCNRCNTLNETAARYCHKCGVSLYRPIGLACPACRSDNLPGEAYCEACGAALPPTPYFVVADSGLRLKAFNADPQEAVLGRMDPLSGLTPDVNLESFAGATGGLSRRHARLFVRDNQFWVEDLHSVNLTYLNNQKLDPEQPQRVKDGDLLRLGNLMLIFRAG